MFRSFFLLLGGLLSAHAVLAAQLPPTPAEPVPAQVALPTHADAATLEAALPAMARTLLAGYADPDPDRELANRMRLHSVAGDWVAAVADIRALRTLRAGNGVPAAATAFLQYEIHAEAMQRRDRAIAPVFARVFGGLDDRTAFRVQPGFYANLAMARRDLDAALARHAGQVTLPLADALELIRLKQFHTAFADLLPQVPDLFAADDARRYIIDTDARFPGADGVTLAGVIVRPRAATTPQPTLLQFTIYAIPEQYVADAKGAAAHGYAGVVVYARGKAGGSGAPAPFEHDGDDAAAAIAWVAEQPWSDGRVGMYGGSYNSFTQWAAAGKRPPALRALLTSASAAPGIDIPYEGGIFHNFMIPWPLYTTQVPLLDDATYGDRERWQRLDRTWYRDGRAFRDLAQIDGHPNPWLERWLQHPTYDAYWQAMTPQGDAFAGIDIPVLAVTGYFDGARVGVQHYYDEHLRHNPDADHTLLFGPWGHIAMQVGVARFVEGYEVDPSALVDLAGLRYAWFDHVLRDGPRPALLPGKVNWQVMGGDRWRHADTLDDMAERRERFGLQAGKDGAAGVLVPGAAPRGGFVQRVGLRDRRDAEREAPELSLTDTLDVPGALVFETAPMAAPVELSGLFSGELHFSVDRRDVDLELALYERLPDGRYLFLSNVLLRASQAADPRERRLLQPGKPQVLAFRSDRVTSRRLDAGSRVVLTLAVPRRPTLQINYGSGKAVADETIADAGDEPMTLRWSSRSWIELPLRAADDDSGTDTP